MPLQFKQHQIASYQNQAIVEYSLIDENGFQVNFLNYGGIITAIYTHDHLGKLGNIVISRPQFNPQNPGQLGAITGPTAGRIAEAKFSLNQRVYQLEQNNGKHNLHGGSSALDKQFWQVSPLTDGARLRYHHPDASDGFPGKIDFVVDYRISSTNQLTLSYTATTDQMTLLNLTNHSYFDLSCGINPLGQLVQIPADYFAAIEADGLTKGELLPVANSPFDFRQPKPLGQDLHQNDSQLLLGNGYDHPFLLNQPAPIILEDPLSRRYLQVTSSEPVCVLYSANSYTPKHVGVCLETQKLPNAINLPRYRNQVIFSPHQPAYRSTTAWQFGVRR